MELRHLRYFTAVVQWRSYREASRRLHVAQPAISRTVVDVEDELGLKLFSRAKRRVQLTPEGEIFYAEAMRTLAQAESAINTAKRAAKGEIGKLSIGFLGSATYVFLPELVRTFKAQYPGVKLILQELSPLQQEIAFDKNTRTCNQAGFSPRVENQPSMMQTVLSLVEAEQGVSIVPACVRNLRSRGVRFYRLLPDDVRVDLVAAWKKETPSVALRALLDLIDSKASLIRKKAKISGRP